MPFQPQEQPVIEVPRVVDPLGIRNERVHEAAEVEELVPVAIVPGQARDVEAEHGPHAAETHLRHEPLKAQPPYRGRPRLALVLVDDDHLTPAQAGRAPAGRIGAAGSPRAGGPG